MAEFYVLSKREAVAGVSAVDHTSIGEFMRLIAHARIQGECPSPTTKVQGRRAEIRAYEIKVQQATPKRVREREDIRYRLRIDFHLMPPRLSLSDLDNMAKTIMDRIFGKFGRAGTKPRDRFVWQLELSKFKATTKGFTEFWLFADEN